MRTCIYGIWVAASVALAACGGGGGGASVDTSAALSSSNYVSVSTQAVATLFSLTNDAGLMTGAQVSQHNNLIQFSKAQLPKMRGWFASAPALLTGAVTGMTENCQGGGTIAIAVTDVNDNEETDAGDSAVATVVNCVVDGTRVNGQLTMVINSTSGTPGAYPYALSATLTLNNLTTTSSQVSTMANGSFTLAVEEISSVVQTSTLTASNLALSSTFDGATVTATLSNYQIIETLGALSSTTSVNGTLNTSVLGTNVLTLSTTVPLMRYYTDSYPSSGQVVATTLSGGKVRVTALSSSSLSVELDATGDNSYEALTHVLWSDMV